MKIKAFLLFAIVVLCCTSAMAQAVYTPPITSPSSVPGLTGYLRVLQTTGTGRGLGVRIQPADTAAWTAPTVSSTSSTDLIANSISWPAVVNSGNGINPVYRYWGNPVYPWRGTLVAGIMPSETLYSGSETPEFSTDAQAFEVVFRNNGGGFQLWVDGYSFGVFTSGATSGATYYRTIKFATRARRNIRIEMYNDLFSSVKTYPGDSVWYPDTPAPLRCVFMGDSYLTGTVGDSGLSYTFYDLANWCGEQFGWNVIPVGSGGTGYITSNQKLTYLQRAVPAGESWFVNTGGPSSGTFAITFNGIATNSNSGALSNFSDNAQLIQNNLNYTFGVYVNLQGATGGSLTLKAVTANKTTSINWNDSASTIQTNMQAQGGGVANAVVTAATGGFVVTNVADTWTLVSSLTGGTANVPATANYNLVCTGNGAQFMVLTAEGTLASVSTAPTITTNTLAYGGTWQGGSVSVTPWLGDVVGNAPDVCIISGGYNDRTAPSALTQAAATTIFTSLKATLPNTLFLLVGPWSPNGTPSTGEPSSTNTQAAVVAANSASGMNAPFVSTFPGGVSWVSGTPTATGTHCFRLDVPSAVTAFTITVGANVATVSQGDTATAANVDSALAAAVASAITHTTTTGMIGGPYILNGITAATPTVAVTGGSGTVTVTPWSTSGNAIYYTGITDSTHPTSPGTNFNGIGGHQFIGDNIAAAIMQAVSTYSLAGSGLR